MKIYKLTFCFLIIVTTSNIHGQSRFNLEFSSSYLVTSRVITRYESELYKDFRNSNEKFLPGFDVSTTLNYKINDSFSFLTGVGYSKNGYMIKANPLIDPGNISTTPRFISQIFRFKYENIYIPFHISYQTNKKLNYSVNFGPSILFPISENLEWVLRTGIEEGGTFETTTITQIYPKSEKMNMTLDLGIGIGYKISNNLNLIIQPKISYYLFNYENTRSKDMYYNISLLDGENKSTKEHFYDFGVTLRLIINP